jgi:hypothetical protein
MDTTENHSEKTTPNADDTPASEYETEVKQSEDVGSSAAFDDSDIDSDDVAVLPGTGGPDDVGDIEVDPAEINPSGH